MKPKYPPVCKDCQFYSPLMSDCRNPQFELFDPVHGAFSSVPAFWARMEGENKCGPDGKLFKPKASAPASFLKRLFDRIFTKGDTHD